MELPKEHGFWVMMPAALVSGTAQANFAVSAGLLSVGAGVAAALLGGLLHKRIRKTDWAQLLASLALALLVVPAEWSAGVSLAGIVEHVAAWGALFVGCGLSVRACFARARKHQGHAPVLQLAALAIPALTTLALSVVAQASTVLVAFIATIGLTCIAVWRPTPKRLQATGVLLALLVVTALVGQLLMLRFP